MNLRFLTVLGLTCVSMLQGCASTGTDTSSFAATFRNAAVAADHRIASQAGASILRQGGNAVDAAVATSFTLSVVRPYSCGLGGGGFMLIHLNNDPTHGSLTTALNYRERAPKAVTYDYYESKPDDAPTIGGTAAGVPGSVAGLLYALDEYGTMDRATVLAPAIAAAESGFIADAHYVNSMATHIEDFERDPAMQERFAFVWKRFLRQGTLKVGSLIRNPEQAHALKLIAQGGAAAFYEGPIAKAIVRTIQSDGGDMTREDLADYFIREGKPVSFNFRGKTFLTMPPPSSGGVAIAQILGLLERNLGDAINNLDDTSRTNPAYIHALAEAMKHAFADRARYMADPDVYSIPTDRLISSQYLDKRAALFDASQTLAPTAYGTTPPPPNDSGTSHLSVVDANGSAVACTETINLTFGSMLAVEEFGFCLNDQMDDFTTRSGQANAFGLMQSDRNLPMPGKRPISSMSPTIVLDEQGRVEAVAGASGGPRIISATLEVLLNTLLHGDSAAQAVAAGRMHHQWMPDTLWFEQGFFAQLERPTEDSPSTMESLGLLGHQTKARGDIASVQLIRRHGKSWQAASDPRKGGRPAGY